MVEHTVPEKNRSGALSAMRSTRRETKDKPEIKPATQRATETGQTRIRTSSSWRNGNGTMEKERAVYERGGQKELC